MTYRMQTNINQSAFQHLGEDYSIDKTIKQLKKQAKQETIV